MDIIDKTESEDTLEALGCDGTAVSKIMVFQNYLHHIICLSLVLVDINNTKYVVISNVLVYQSSVSYLPSWIDRLVPNVPLKIGSKDQNIFE